VWFDCREEGSKSMVGICKLGGSEAATPPANKLYAMFVRRPGAFTLLENFKRNFGRIALK
jgi:hypothetical protein